MIPVRARELDLDHLRRVLDRYVVLDYNGRPDVWLLCPPGHDFPPPVPNRSMRWRRPTFEEVIERQRLYDENPRRFFSLMAGDNHHEGVSRYRWRWVRGSDRRVLLRPVSSSYDAHRAQEYLDACARRRETA